jgi:hypothetical protein
MNKKSVIWKSDELRIIYRNLHNGSGSLIPCGGIFLGLIIGSVRRRWHERRKAKHTMQHFEAAFTRATSKIKERSFES